jgi:hypothetical protein
MNIAFDDEGKMMNVVKLNPDKFAEVGKGAQVDSFLNEGLTKVVKSTIMQEAQEFAQKNTKVQENQRMNESELTDDRNMGQQDSLDTVMFKT